jgi:hypothetical protein
MNVPTELPEKSNLELEQLYLTNEKLKRERSSLKNGGRSLLRTSYWWAVCSQ